MKKRCILVVEDDPLLRDLTRRQLNRLGFEPLLVDCAEAALECDYSAIALIFMDIGLPGIDGAHATMLIREQELRDNRRRIPIIALTGHADKEKAILVGMDDFLQKPAMLSDLEQIIQKWLPPSGGSTAA